MKTLDVQQYNLALEECLERHQASTLPALLHMRRPAHSRTVPRRKACTAREEG